MSPRPIRPTTPVPQRATDRSGNRSGAAARILFRLALLLTFVLSVPVRAADEEQPAAPSSHSDRSADPQRPPLLVMFVRPKFSELAPAAREARESLVRVLEGLRFKVYSPDDVAKLMTTDEQKTRLGDDSTGNLMSLGRKIGVEKVLYSELETDGKKRIFKLALLPSAMRGSIRYSRAEYSQEATDPEMDLAVANALITLFGWDEKKK